MLVGTLQRVRSPSADEPESGGAAYKPSIWLLSALALLVLALAGSRMVLGRYVVFDDAYMSYRYAKHLAFGHGLVWNVGERPLEGYTNPLLVFMLAPFVRFGADPLLVTRALSALAALGIACVVYVRERRDESRERAALLALAYLGSNFAFALVMVGLETVLFTFALYGGYHFGSEYLATRRARFLKLAGATLFAALLLRPEAGLLAVLVTAVAAPDDWKASRLTAHVRVVAATFWGPLAIYLLWKLYYFGTIVPNPAHIKVPSGGLIVERGAETVFGFLTSMWKLLLLGVLAIPLARGRALERLLAAALCCVYAAFYLRVDTLMDIYHRFLFPIAPFLFELAAPAILGALGVLARLGRRGFVEVAVLVAISLGISPESDDIKNVRRAMQRQYDFSPHPRTEPAENGHSRHMLEAGRVLAEFPGIQSVLLAAADAGALPYVSDVRHLDLVGLNDRFIAREHDLDKLLSYVFGRKPDIILERDRADGTLISYGHGTLGDHTRWGAYAGWDDYAYAGTLVDVEPWRHELHVFVRKAAPAGLFTFLRRRFVDYVRPEAPVYGTARAKLRAKTDVLALAPLPLADRSRLPVSIAPSHDFLVDARGEPFLVRGDAGWSSSHAIDREGFETYLQDRKQRGFNAILLSVADHTKDREGFENAYKQKPFTTPGDFSTPNQPYFEHLDWLLGQSQAAGFLVFVCPAYLGYMGGDEGWYTNMLRNGADKLREYGRFVGSRWRDLDNVVWVDGGDFNPPPVGMTLMNAVAAGIKEADPRHMHTAHFGEGTSAGDLAPPLLDIDTTYTYAPTYLKVAKDHAADRGKRPLMLIEAIYENEHDSRPPLLRAQAYHALLNGASGNFFGSLPIWNFGEGWRKGLDSPGSRSMTHLFELFESLPWTTLRPEPPEASVVSGLGEFGSNDRLSAARSDDGGWILVYVPSAREIRVNLARLRGPLHARWFDPSAGRFRTIAEGLLTNDRIVAFVPPGTNAGGDSDWVLVLNAE